MKKYHLSRRQRWTVLYGITLALVCASVIVGPAVSTELVVVNFVNPVGNGAASGAVATGNLSAFFSWSNAAFTLLPDGVVKLSLETSCSAGPDDPCDKNWSGSGEPIAFTGVFNGTGWNPGVDQFTLALNGTHDAALASLLWQLSFDNLDGPETANASLLLSSPSASFSDVLGPLLVPFANFQVTAVLTFGPHLGNISLPASATANFDVIGADVPEPASAVLFTGGLVVLAWMRRRMHSE